MPTDVISSVTTGARCYIPDNDVAWLPVYVESVDEDARLVTVRIQRPRPECPMDHDDSDRSGEVRVVALSTGFPLQNAKLSRHIQGVANMIDLNHLHEAAILRNLRKRFHSRLPYTYTGDICLAVNPYQWLDELYTPRLHTQYLEARTRQELPPHVYAVSVAAFKHMCEHSQNQSILVSGESGAGKTETTKILMDNLAMIASSSSTTKGADDSITSRIIQVNPLLESFGNAKTTRNDNSSRFGKFTQLQFDANAKLCGAQCETYLLEKTRVISHERGERNYHIFYQLLHGTTEAESDAMGLGPNGPKFGYLQEKEPQNVNRHGRKIKSDEVEPVKPQAVQEAEIAKDRARFAKTREALTLLGLTPEQQIGLFHVLSGILHLGEAQFVTKIENDEACDLVMDSVVYSSLLLGLDPEMMATALTHRTMKAAGDVYRVPLTVDQALSGRDALAKAIYASIFDWLVAGINASLGAACQVTRTTIGVLDIFGFESFQYNSFEQLCINYANEKLQEKFTQDVFRAVEEEYEREEITWAHIAYADNSDTLALIDGRMGILALLNEEIVRPRGNEEGFVNKLASAYLKQKQLIDFPRTSKTQFAIHHYAGTVLYEAMGFLDKHKDALLSDLSELMCHSHESLPQMLFKAKAEMEAAESKRLSSSLRKSGGNGAEKTVGMQFKQSLTSLMTTISTTNVNYIRCIKPNSSKSSIELEDKMVANQLRCAGVIEAICIARAGYPNRLLHAEFATQFQLFLTANDQVKLQQDPDANSSNFLKLLLEQFDLETPEEYQMGRTRIYLQKGVLEKLERVKAKRLFAYVAMIQAQWRGKLARCQYHWMKAALLTLQRRAKVFVIRTRFLCIKAALALIQRVWRGYIGRCIFHSILRDHCCLTLQRVWRGYTGRKTFLFVLRSKRAVQIQRMWRGHKGRQIVAAVIRQIRAVQLQCWGRQYLARQELHRRRVAHDEKLKIEAQERLARELARLEEERRREEEERRQAVRLASAVVIQTYVRGYFARCVFADMLHQAEEDRRRRREEEEERERIRLQREHDEREAQRRIAEETAREKKRVDDERKQKAIAMRVRREKAIIVIQRVVRGHLTRKHVRKMQRAVISVQRVLRGYLARKQVARMEEEIRQKELEAEEAAALRLQSLQRGRLARQEFSRFKLEIKREKEQAMRIRTVKKDDVNLARIVKKNDVIRTGTVEKDDRTRSRAIVSKTEKDEELARVLEENTQLKKQLAELQKKNRELEAVVAECRCDRDVVKASTNLKRVELTHRLKAKHSELDRTRGEYSALRDFLEKSGSSRRSTEPEELNSSDNSSDSSSNYGDEENNNWKEDRPTVNSLSASYYGGDRPSKDIAKLLSSSQTRLANAVHHRRQQASHVVQQRKQQATNAMHHRLELNAQRRDHREDFTRSMPIVSRTKKWATFSRHKSGKGPSVMSPVGYGE
ncbi:myosin-like protein [Plasmopara halstedii]|uniref:Myosin-like protein n=1 Tax=Plasmopara halstedii TaxID=4781 RepID=A0A0P1ASB2_PLAHL|nr:myosin-like protein [Plasmopara halstedii]CEG44284.1 myosin-like protein [Plasmopara halstedii]|eukprot:XP_024580653.1 myosin-like protein [Plasmopara halstedii]